MLFSDTRKPLKMFQDFMGFLGFWRFGPHNSPICNYLEKLEIINGNRSLRQQISMIHKESGIRCLLLFDNDALFRDSPATLCRYIEKVPNCELL